MIKVDLSADCANDHVSMLFLLVSFLEDEEDEEDEEDARHSREPRLTLKAVRRRTRGVNRTCAYAHARAT